MRSADGPDDASAGAWAVADLDKRLRCADGLDFAARPSAQTATVCQVLHGLPVGGAEVLAARLARQLNGDYRFLFICLDTLGSLGEELRHEGFTVQVLNRRPGLDWSCTQTAGRDCPSRAGRPAARPSVHVVFLLYSKSPVRSAAPGPLH